MFGSMFGLAVITVQELFFPGAGELVYEGTAATVAAGAHLVHGAPIAHRGIRRFFGSHGARLVNTGINLATLALAGLPLGLIVVGVEAGLMLKEVLGTSDFSKLTKAQLAQGVALFSKIKPNLVTIAASFGDVIDVMSRGDAGLCVLGYGLVQSTLLSRKIKCTNYAPTKTGGMTGADLYCIAADAPNPTGSYAVLNAVLAPKGNALMSSFQYTAVTNPAAVPYLPKNQRHLFPYNNINSYLTTSPLWKSPPPTVSDSKLASQTDVTNAWTTLSS